jgi:hypothetical protein
MLELPDDDPRMEGPEPMPGFAVCGGGWVAAITGAEVLPIFSA